MGSLAVVEVRKFGDAQLQAAIDRALAAVPAGQHGAVVAHATTQGAALSLYAKLGEHWSLAAAAYKPFSGALSAEAELRFVW